MDAVRILKDRLPASWRVEAREKEPASVSLRSPAGVVARLPVLERKHLEPRDIRVLGAEERLAGRLVVVPFLGPRTRALLEELGASYVDATGNVRIEVDRPGIFIRLEGAKKNPAREPQPLTSLKGPASARVVRALCDFQAPYGIRELAAKAGSSPASVSRVVRLLEKDALLERSGDAVASVDWPALLTRWSADYQFLRSNDAQSFLEPRGIEALLGKLRTLPGRSAVTGSLAAARKAPVAGTRLATVYVDDPETAASRLNLRAADSGANVMLVRPFSQVALERTWSEEGVPYAALSQVAADLLTSPGRGPSEGEELIGWMKRNESAWRA